MNFSNKENTKIRKLALKYKIPAMTIKMVCVLKNVTPAKAAKIIEKVINEDREKGFDF